MLARKPVRLDIAGIRNLDHTWTLMCVKDAEAIVCEVNAQPQVAYVLHTPFWLYHEICANTLTCAEPVLISPFLIVF